MCAPPARDTQDSDDDLDSRPTSTSLTLPEGRARKHMDVETRCGLASSAPLLARLYTLPHKDGVITMIWPISNAVQLFPLLPL